MNPMLGEVRQNVFSVMLATPYLDFNSPCGIRGLCKEEGQDLHILAVLASEPGTGQLRHFITHLKGITGPFSSGKFGVNTCKPP